MKKPIKLQTEKEDQSLRFQLDIDASELNVRETPFGVTFDLGRAFKVETEPGTPALPSKIFQIALPGNVLVVEIEALVKKCKKLFKSPVFIMPTPRYQVAQNPDTDDMKPERELARKFENIRELAQREVLRGIPSAETVLMPDVEKYNRAFLETTPVAELVSTVIAGSNTIANVRIAPITINKDFIPELNESIEVIVRYSEQRNTKTKQNSTTRSFTPNQYVQQAYTKNLKDLVINPRDVVDFTRFPWEIFGDYDYLVITDNHKWDSQKIERHESIGDMQTAFQRLVDWKIEKGLKARVVTISDVVDGRYGNFKAGARDLQEVIRSFLKFARSNWGVTWCLLGGDTEIVPVREAAGEIRGDVNTQTANNPPQDNQAFWTGTFMKVKAVSLGEWFSVNDSYLKLTNKNTGRLIPKKAPFSIFNSEIISEAVKISKFMAHHFFHETTAQFRNRLGWYFCTDETYTTYSSTPTQFVRVDGAASIINAPLRFHYTWNTIPTDFYYSSLFGPNYGVTGKHDWDFNNNGIYGQHEGTNDFDPINWNADVIVGRAPASTSSQADTFVQKVISYEKFRTEDGVRLDRNYIDKMLFVSENWGGRLGFSQTTTNPPAAGTFFTQVTEGRAVIQTADDFAQNSSWQLISYLSDSDARIIPYNRNAGPSSRGWYYAFSGADLRQAVIKIPLPWGTTIDFPLITHTLVAYGNGAEITPSYFILDHVEADGSMMDQEALRTQVDTELSFVTRFDRLYEDLDSLPFVNRVAAPLRRITSDEVRDALNAGQHFVSLSGHGNMYYCCKVDNYLASSLTNANKHFILFADSCLTNSFSTDDAMAEALLNNPNGGAIAYLGHTRFSWIGYGDDYQRAFFRELLNTRHIGLMHTTRLNFVQANPHHHVHRWTVLALNLLGDPEMEVWNRKPLSLIPDLRFYEEFIHIRVINPEDFARKPLRDAELVAYIGDTTQRTHANEDGLIEVPIALLENDNLRLVIRTEGNLPLNLTSKEVKDLMRRARPEPVEEVAPAITEVEEVRSNVITIPIEDVPKVKEKLADLQAEPS